MKNKVLLIFSFMLCAMNNSYGSEFGTLHNLTIAIVIGAVVGAGTWTADLNKKYAEKDWNPDWKLRLSKAIGAGAILLGTDILSNNTSDTKLNLCKLAAATISLLAITDTVGKEVRKLPVVGAILTDPAPNGKEKKDSGMFWRALLVYVPLKAALIRYFVPYARFQL